jgi:branched-chain amino acid transport system ATP-binding protein
VLSLESVTVRYGAITAVSEVSIDLAKGQVGALLGANGAGKSSLLNAISGRVRPAGGRIMLDGRDITRVKAYQRKGLGLAHALEGHRVFGELSVQENLLLGGLPPGRHSMNRARQRSLMEREFDRFPVLGDRRRQRAGLLSGGEQQMLTISTALMSDPRMLLLDEPSLGLSPKISALIFSTVSDLAREGLTIVLVEQSVEQALRIADQAWVMRQGRVLRQGSAADIAQSDDIAELYLGVGH